MGKYFVRFHPRAFAQDFHIPPDVAPVQRPARPGDKHRPCCNPVPFQIAFQQTAQLFRQENAAPFSLVGNLRPARGHGLCGDLTQFRDPNSGGADGLEHQGKALLPLPPGGVHQAHIVGPGQLPPFITEQSLLNLQKPDRQFSPSHEPKKAVDRRQHGIDRGRGVPAGQVPFPLQQNRLGQRPAPEIGQQRSKIMEIFLNGAVRPLLFPQIGAIAPDLFC